MVSLMFIIRTQNDSFYEKARKQKFNYFSRVAAVIPIRIRAARLKGYFNSSKIVRDAKGRVINREVKPGDTASDIA